MLRLPCYDCARMSDEPKDLAETARSGRVAIVGRPNVGKSTLLNALLGQKLVIATPTPGTTRSNVIGVFARTDPPTQIAFVDTPGLARPKSALGKALGETARAGLVDADLVLFVTEAPTGKARLAVHPDDEPVLDHVRETGQPALLVINKVDTLRDKSRLLPLIEAYRERLPFEAIVPLSATDGTNVDALVGEIRARLPEGLIYDDDVLTDKPERFFAAELVREAVLRQTRQEVPHGSAVLIEDYAEEGGLVRITATVVVEKESHKKIVIGARGSRIKEIGTEARLEIEKLLEKKVFLKLWVKVVPGWTNDPARVREMISNEGST